MTTKLYGQIMYADGRIKRVYCEHVNIFEALAWAKQYDLSFAHIFEDKEPESIVRYENGVVVHKETEKCALETSVESACSSCY